MKKFKKVCAVILGFIMLIGITATAAVSNSGSQDGIQAVIQTDKNSYDANEDIRVNITVTNTNNYTVKNVSIEGLLPDDLTLKEGSLKSDTVNLNSGETLTIDCVAVLEKEIVTEPDSTESDTTESTTEETTESTSDTTEESTETDTETTEHEETETTTEETSTVETTETEPTLVEPSTVPDTTDGEIILPIEPTTERNSPSTTVQDDYNENAPQNPSTGDSFTFIKVLTCLAVAGAAIIGIVVIQNKNGKKATKVISLILCGTIAFSGIAATGFLSVTALESDYRSFTVQTVVTVDGGDYTLEGKVNYEVSATEEGDVKLYSDPKELSTSDDPQNVLFYIDTENTTGTCDVTLFNAENGKELTSMQDNGKNGDKTSDDGIYSTTISVDCSEETTVQYYAVVDDGITKVKSRVREINIFAPMTNEEAENMAMVDNCLADLTRSSEYVNASDDDKAFFMKQTLENMLDEGLITDYQFSNDDAMVAYTYPNGITAYWNVQQSSDEYEYMGPADMFHAWDDFKNRTLKKSSPESEKPFRLDKILYIHDWQDYEADIDVDRFVSQLNKEGYDALSVYSPYVEQYKKMLTDKNYKYIVLAAHGSPFVDSKGEYVRTAITTHENVETNKDLKYCFDLFTNRISKLNNRYVLFPSFFSFYYENKLNGTIVDMQSCMGVGVNGIENYGFSSAFLDDCNASTYIGYHNPVYVSYASSLTASILQKMKDNKNIGEAYVEAIDYWGKNDIDYMYRHGSKSDSWLKPDESGKTLKEKVQEKEKNEEIAYPVMTGSAKTTLNATVKFAGGDGSINNPYQIATAQQLDAVRYHLDSNFVLVDDIDMSEYENWEPIGGYIDVEPGDGLRGTFDGQGHTISNLKIDYTIMPTGDSHPDYYFGLFSDTTLSPGIRNVDLENIDINISGEGDIINPGVNESAVYISGFSTKASLLTNIHISGKIVSSVKSDSYIGGISYIGNEIINSSNSAEIKVFSSENLEIGGIASGANLGRITTKIYNCNNYGDIYATTSGDNLYVGGVIANDGGTFISNCNNYGNLEGNSNNTVELGGIVAEGQKTDILTCANYGRLSARTYALISTGAGTYVGGIIADGDGSDNNPLKVENCVNFGNLTSFATTNNRDGMPNAYCAGIIAYPKLNVQLSKCYNLSENVEGQCRNDYMEDKPELGRIVAHNNYPAIISNCYSLESTLLNGLPAAEYIGSNQKNGGSMTRAEIEKAVTDLGFKLPT